MKEMALEILFMGLILSLILWYENKEKWGLLGLGGGGGSCLILGAKLACALVYKFLHCKEMCRTTAKIKASTGK